MIFHFHIDYNYYTCLDLEVQSKCTVSDIGVCDRECVHSSEFSLVLSS